MIVVDYTARIAPAALKAAGVSGVCRYLKPDSAPAYRITLAEYRELLAAGIDVTLNWEFDALDWLGGAGRGTAHGNLAVAQARALGYPSGGVIVGSADFDMGWTQWQAAARGYAQAFAAAVRAGGYRPGVYGPWAVLTWVRDAGLMDAYWQAGMSTAWSGGQNAKAWPGAHLRQRGKKWIAGQETDWNEILIPDWGRTVDDMGTTWTQPLTQGTAGYAGQQRDTALAFAWQASAEAAAGVGKLLAAAAADEVRDKATLAAIEALATGGGNPDAVPTVVAAINAVRDEARARFAELADQHTAEMAARAQEHAAEVAGLRAELAALGG